MVGSGHTSAPISALQFLSPPHVLILEARFYNHINDLLLEGAKKALDRVQATYEVLTVPGALEIPVALQFAAMRRNGRPFDAFVALGCVIRGETSHYDIVAGESSRGLMDAALRLNLAIGNGVLTVENEAQAMERADPARMDKGGGAAMAALSMLHLKHVCGIEI
jgi:6,7-dimethyl-8-ribityllumazine synthase